MLKHWIVAVTGLMMGYAGANEAIQPTASSAAPEVKEQIILNNPVNLQALKTLIGPELGTVSGSPAPQATGQGVAPTSPTPSPLNTAGGQARMTAQVRPGETLDRILARTMGTAPVSASVVRQAVVQMNPSAFIGGSPHRLVAGATLRLPTAQELISITQQGRQLPAAAVSEGVSTQFPHVAPADDRRHWVRYP